MAESPSVASWKLFQPPPNRRIDENFQLETETYEDEAVFQFDILLAEDASLGSPELEARVRYQVCDDRLCLPPVRKTATAALKIDPAATAAAPAIADGYVEATAAAALTPSAQTAAGAARLTRLPTPQSEGIIPFAGIAFGFGLLAIFHALCIPDDSDHHVVLCQHASRFEETFLRPGNDILCRRGCAFHRFGDDCFAGAGTFRTSPTGLECLGQPVHCAGVRRLRGQSTGCFRDHGPERSADQARPRGRPRRELWARW